MKRADSFENRESTEGVPRDLGTERLLWVFALLSMLTLAVLSTVLARSHFLEWKKVQREYNRQAAQAGAKPVAVELQQVWKPDLGIADRCQSCHLGMSQGVAALAGSRLFGAHPPVVHEPAEMGCTPCHSGQGLATTAKAAHGDVAHWDQPLLPPGYYEAGCGTCHSHLRVGSPGLVARGADLLERYDCLACHLLNGRGGVRGVGPSLAKAGYAGPSRDWHERHLRLREAAAEKLSAAGSTATTDPTLGQERVWQASYGPIPGPDVLAVTEFLREQVGAPRLMEGKALAHRLGCRGCHRINGVGGDLGPDLTRAGLRAVKDLDFTHVPGPRTLPNWLGAHFRSPGGVVAGSGMPELRLTEAQTNALTYYVLSLRPSNLPTGARPKDRLLVEKLGEREFPTDGEGLFATFCSACHGPQGQGRRFGQQAEAFPAIGGADFLASASDRFLRETMTGGRPGRKMPAWGTKEGGLRPAEIDAIVGFLRSLQPAAPAAAEVAAAVPDVELGQRLYVQDCRVCHGARGEGALGPALDASGAATLDEPARVRRVMLEGNRDRGMESFSRYTALELASIEAKLRELRQTGSRTGARARAPVADASAGRAVYANLCAGCHGPKGEGTEAPALANPGLMAAASDGFLQSTIQRGRMGTAMPHFGRGSAGYGSLSADEVRDVVAYLRTMLGQQAGAANTPATTTIGRESAK